ncbi:lecithin retinol acyltransferase family protein [Rheinheimera sp.]|uniref:lecithin retinol acyltransferase family protein n=1 Tax=Rheinheimera sp. TaxID=1869214 RepID=UPI002FDC7D13
MICEIFHLFEHSGIYIGEGQIVELQGTGLVRSVSITRFFDNRSGNHLLAACNKAGEVLISPECAQRAVSQIFTYQRYDLLTNNCHRFTQACVSGRSLPITSFFDLNTELSHFWRTEVSWLQVDIHR